MRLERWSRPWAPLALAGMVAGPCACGVRSESGGGDFDGPPAQGSNDADASLSSREGSGEQDGSPDADDALAVEESAPEQDGDDGDDASDDDGAGWEASAPNADGASDAEPADEGGSGVEGGHDVTVTGRAAGQPCATGSDCASALCAGGQCADAVSCLRLLLANPGLPDREYEIDPDGQGVGLDPFVVYCDMTTDGGGWTTLPLRFDDPGYWSITQTGDACVTIDVRGGDGNFRQYQSTTAAAFAYTYLEFVPPIAAATVRFVDFDYTNGGSSNTMDFLIGAPPSLANTSYEDWYFADPAAPLLPLGYVFSTPASCIPPYDIEYGVTCSRDALAADGGAPTAPFLWNETVALSTAADHFDMALVEGCPSYPVNPVGDGEQFHIETAPAADGVWMKGIAVR